MRISRAAIGLAAVGAGILVARLLNRRSSGHDVDIKGREPSPDPNTLIGEPVSHKSARESADILRRPQ